MILILCKSLFFFILGGEIIYFRFNMKYPMIDRQSAYMIMSYISVPFTIFRLLMYEINPILGLAI